MSMFRGVAPQSPILFPPARLLGIRSGPDDVEAALRSHVDRCFPGTRPFFLSSGRAALFLLLRALWKEKGGVRDRVILPAYTCPSVPYTVNRAGLRVCLCDFEPGSFTLSEDHLIRLIDEKVLAVVPTHLFGIPSDPARVKSLAESRGAVVIEDFAHAVGSSLDGRPAGTLADFAFTSLGRGKMLTTDEGGILLAPAGTDTRELEAEMAVLDVDRNGRWPTVIRLGLLYGLIAGGRWGLIAGGPFDPEKRERSYAFRPRRLSPLKKALLRDSLAALTEFNGRRQRNAEELRRGLLGREGLVFPEAPEGGDAVPMMFPVLVEDPGRLERIYGRLRRERLGPSKMYRHSLKTHLEDGFVNREDEFPAAEFLAEHLVTLPCHPFVRRGDVERILAVFREL